MYYARRKVAAARTLTRKGENWRGVGGGELGFQSGSSNLLDNVKNLLLKGRGL